MIAASVTAQGFCVRDGEVLVDQRLVELGQPVVGVVSDDANFFPRSFLDPSGHVELAHGNDFDTVGFVVVRNGLGTKEAGFLNVSLSPTCNGGDEGGFTSAEYQWNSTVRLGLKSDSKSAL